MNINQAKEIVIKAINEVLKGKLNVTEEMQLIGNNPLLDSMKLVEVCLTLEELAEESGFEFDWTSETTMSKSLSMFRSVNSLSEEFARQSEL
tara:strand:- start:218 stop:493 length:276 start_codon:yes stop_codon:yes gene_type:complete